MLKVATGADVSPFEARNIIQAALNELGEPDIIVARRSRHTDRDWTDQLRRVRRWHKRLDDVPATVTREGKEAALDYIDAFFLACFHLKDWVKASGHPKANEVEQFIADHAEMELSRKLCNASKHFELSSGSAMRTDAHAVFIDGVRQQEAETWIVIDDDGREWEMFQLANRCMALWEGFLK
jgi:hypothetical protein